MYQKPKHIDNLSENLTEKDYAISLGYLFGIERNYHCGRNISLYNDGTAEADFLYITKTNYLYEIEIKLTIEDFKADLMKKHYHDHPEVKGFYYAIPISLYKKHTDTIDEICKENNAGLLVYQKGQWRVIYKAKRRREVAALSKERIFHYLRIFAKKWITN